MDTFEAISTRRATRFLKPDLLPLKLLERIVWAGTRAPIPGNSHADRFVIVTDCDKICSLGSAVREAMTEHAVDPGTSGGRRAGSAW